MRRSQIGWYTFQIAVVGGTAWLYQTQVNASPAGLDYPVQPHVAVLIGIGLALILTVALDFVFTRLRKLTRQRR